jgi:hypothetical protein
LGIQESGQFQFSPPTKKPQRMIVLISAEHISQDLHHLMVIPEERVRVIFGSWIEPEVNSLLPSSNTLTIDVCLKLVWFSTLVAQKFKVKLAVGVTLPRHLHMRFSKLNKT